MTLEIELKGVVDDVDAARNRLEAAGARMEFAGRLEDRRYDTANRELASRDEVLRLRVSIDERATRASLQWKGPTRYDGGYKLRDEITTDVSDVVQMAAILERMGYAVSGEIDRDVAQYVLGGAVVRFERYPRMDSLVEVEGTGDAIERAISALGMARNAFTADRLAGFIARFEHRTGTRAAVSERQLAGDFTVVDFTTEDAMHEAPGA